MSKPPLPTFKSDAEAEEFVASADLTDFDLSGGERVRFEFKKKSASVHLRLPPQLLSAVKERAAREGIPYQRFIRLQLERSLQEKR
ncbi:MAG: CopG family antitoxin [Rhodospirillaceae bacterium]